MATESDTKVNHSGVPRCAVLEPEPRRIPLCKMKEEEYI